MTLDEFAKLAGDSQRAGYGKERNELLARIAKIDEMYPELASTGDTPQPQERKCAALLDWFIAGIRTYTSPDPMPFADETYELRKKIIGYIEAGQNAALGKTPDAREEKEK